MWKIIINRIRSSWLYRKYRNIFNTLLPLYPAGHYHSSIPSLADIQTEAQIYPYDGIQMDCEVQFALLKELSQYYDSVAFVEEKAANRYYFYQNRYFSYSDAIILHCIIGHFKPQKIVELGSGFSTACMIDSIHSLNLETVVESYDINSDRVNELIGTTVIESRFNFTRTDIRELNDELFKDLKPNDILFIDSSHVSKYASDLNHIFFHILALLPSGVIIHFHDVFKNFEYPKAWIDESIFWNEQYMIRSFLQFNSEFEILLLTDELESRYTEWYQSHMPICLQAHEKYSTGPNKGQWIEDLRGQSLWLRKI